jgi:hypothetical protein
MSESLADWLALRESADASARSARLTKAVADRLSVRVKAGEPLRALDLATGTGSNVRYLSPRLPHPQEWLIVDRDAELLERTPKSSPGCRIETRAIELASLDPGLFAGRHLVTASALLDLVSEDWLKKLAGRCREAGTAVLFTLTYNGRSRCSPAEPEDEEMRELLNAHQQQNDKGFGRAAGPAAVGHAARAFTGAGYHVRREPSDWMLSPDSRDLQRQLVDGWAAAAEELVPEESPRIRGWLARRLAHVEEGRSRIVVCHEDLAAWPA